MSAIIHKLSVVYTDVHAAIEGGWQYLIQSPVEQVFRDGRLAFAEEQGSGISNDCPMGERPEPFPEVLADINRATGMERSYVGV